MRVTIRGYKYTLRSAVRSVLRDFGWRLRRIGLTLVLGSIAVALFSLVSHKLAIVVLSVFLAVVFLRDLIAGHTIVAYPGWPFLARLTTALISAFLLSAIVYIPFFVMHSGGFLKETGILLATVLVVSVVVSLVATIAHPPIAFDNQVCPDCGVVMDTVKDYFDWDGYDDRRVGPGQVIRTPGPLRRFVTYKCPSCDFSRKEVY